MTLKRLPCELLDRHQCPERAGQAQTGTAGRQLAALGIYEIPNAPSGLCFDGINVWIVCGGTAKSVTVLKAADGSLVGTQSPQSGTGYPCSICFDGMNIWIGHSNSTAVKMKACDGSLLGSYSIGTGIPTGLCFDGTHIWVTNSTSNNVTKI